MVKLRFVGDPKVKHVFEARLAVVLGEQVVSGDPPDIAVVVRRSRLGGVEDVPRAVEDLLGAPEPPVVVAVVGSHDRDAEQLFALGVPEECVLRGTSVRLAELVEVVARAYRDGLRPALLVYGEDEVVGDTVYAEEGAVPTPRGSGRVLWFASPAAGAGQTTLLASVAAIAAVSTGEKVAVLDLFRPPVAYLHFGGDAVEFERRGDLLRGKTRWGTVCVPVPELALEPRACREIARFLTREFDRVLVDAPAGFCEPDVLVVRGDPQTVRLLKDSPPPAGALLALSLCGADRAGPEYLQSVLEREVGRRADVVVPFDPEVARAVGRPASEVSEAVGRAAAELASLLGERAVT